MCLGQGLSSTPSLAGPEPDSPPSNTEQWDSPCAKQNSCSAVSTFPCVCMCAAIKNIAPASSRMQLTLAKRVQQQTWINRPSVLTLRASKRMHSQDASSVLQPESFSSGTGVSCHPTTNSPGVHRQSRLPLISQRLISWLIIAWSLQRCTSQNVSTDCMSLGTTKKRGDSSVSISW
ncbi:hypothetical protein GOODEAATRI_000167 [Goodea atripinnis]|uniref:Uncharacterized protein n=1 Tax=Goodea atripinnis TaxID=208336 RepID=A0ABV0MDU4_9TELE